MIRKQKKDDEDNDNDIIGREEKDVTMTSYLYFFSSQPPTHSKSYVLYEANYFIVTSILIMPFLSYLLQYFSYTFLLASFSIHVQKQNQKQLR